MSEKGGIFSIKKNLHDFFIPAKNQMQALDGLRALAIIYVIIFHALYLTQTEFKSIGDFVNFSESTPAWLNWIWHGDKGVDMFFIISGFLIASIMMKEHQKNGNVNIPRFYARRALRIIPVYVLALAIAALAKRGGGNAEYFWTNLLFINNILPLEKIFIPWSWSLSIEVQFYILFPFILLFLYTRKKPVLYLIMFIFIACLVRYAVILAHPELYQKAFFYHVIKDGGRSFFYFEKLYVNLYTRAGPLLLGVMIAYFFYYQYERTKRCLSDNPILSISLGILALILITATTSVSLYTPNIKHSEFFNIHFTALSRNLFSLGVSIVLLLALFKVSIGKIFSSLLSQAFWYPIARAAYVIYLFHIPFIALAYMTLGVQFDNGLLDLKLSTSLAAALLALFYTLIFSIPIYLFIEKPFMNIYRKRTSLHAGQTPQSAPTALPDWHNRYKVG